MPKKNVNAALDKLVGAQAEVVFNIFKKHLKSTESWADCGPRSRAACFEVAGYFLQMRWGLKPVKRMIPLKEFLMREAKKDGVTTQAVYMRMQRGTFPNIKIHRITPKQVYIEEL